MHIELKYTTLEARRLGQAAGRVEIHNNSTLTDVARMDDKLSIDFTFTCDYGQEVGLIKIEGNLLLSDTEEDIAKIIDEWGESDKKNLPPDFAEKVHNTIIANCVVEATILSRDIQLPAPTPPPRVSMTKKDVTKSESESREDTSNYIR